MGLPIRRPKPKEKQIVLAFPDELEDWVRQQTAGVRATPRKANPSEVTPEVLADALRLYREPIREANREGLERMHILLAQMMQSTQVVHASAEHLFRNLQEFRKNRSKIVMSASLRRTGTIL